MTPAEFGEAIDEFEKLLDEKVGLLTLNDTLDPFSKAWAYYVKRVLKGYRHTVSVYEEKDAFEVPLEGFALEDMKDAYRDLAVSINGGFSRPTGRLRQMAEAKASRDVADWLEELHRHGKGNLLGLRIPEGP